jgi:hypothetical protein
MKREFQFHFTRFITRNPALSRNFRWRCFILTNGSCNGCRFWRDDVNSISCSILYETFYWLPQLEKTEPLVLYLNVFKTIDLTIYQAAIKGVVITSAGEINGTPIHAKANNRYPKKRTLVSILS